MVSPTPIVIKAKKAGYNVKKAAWLVVMDKTNANKMCSKADIMMPMLPI